MKEEVNLPRKGRPKVVFEAAFVEQEDPLLWEDVEKCLQSFQFFERWWKDKKE